MVEVREYTDENGRSPFADWAADLDMQARKRVVARVQRVRAGNFGDHKSVKGGVYELRIDFGPGYRVYYGKDSDTLVILLGGGTKKRQEIDIATAKALWKQYKRE